MFKLGRRSVLSGDLTRSSLLNEKTFYTTFGKGLARCRNELIIESPFITSNRMAMLFPSFRQLTRRGVKIIVNTRDPLEHEAPFDRQAEDAIVNLQDLGVKVLFTGGHHRKLVVVDRQVLYEGSLNVLSQNDSCEVMRRIESHELSEQMIQFVGLHKFIR